MAEAQEQLAKASQNEFGAFYPTGHVLAVFRSAQKAFHTQELLAKELPPGSAVGVLTGKELIELAAEMKNRHGLWSRLMASLSRFMDTEQSFIDRDLESAADGAAFLLIPVKSPEDVTRIDEIIKPLKPLAARYYRSEGVQVLSEAIPNDPIDHLTAKPGGGE